MAKISIVIADSDELYLNHIANYLIANTHSFEVYSFTSKDSMIKYITDPSVRSKIDVIAFSEDFSDEAIVSSPAPAKIVLSDGSYAGTEFAVVNKYQKADKFINEIVMIYAEYSGNSSAVMNGDKATKVIGFYSPVGGSGKTTLAVATACALSKMGKKVFYFNAEKLNSTGDVLHSTYGGSLSDLYLTLKTKGASVSNKIIANRSVDLSSGISFINAGESSLEINEITTDEFKKLITGLENMGEFDVAVIDFDSEFNKEKITMLGSMDKIVCPFTADSLSLSKLDVFVKELDMYDELRDIGFKLLYVLNKSDTQSISYIQNSGKLGGCEVKANIARNNGFAELQSVLHAGDAIVAAMAPIVENI